jgi:HIT domain
MSECPFCARVTEGTAFIHQSEVAVSVLDAFPVSEGHVLVVPRRHLARVEELDPDEWAGLFALTLAPVSRRRTSLAGIGPLASRLRPTSVTGIAFVRSDSLDAPRASAASWRHCNLCDPGLRVPWLALAILCAWWA